MKIKGNIRKFVEALDIKNVGDQMIEQLVDKGFVKTPADLFELTSQQVSSIERKGEAHFKKMVQGLSARKRVSLEKFLGALNIPHAGEGTFINLIQSGVNTLEAFMNLTVSQALSASRVGQKAAESIVAFLKEHSRDIQRLRQHMDLQTSEGKKLAGKSFLFTGKANRPRSQLEALVRDNGGVVAGSVTAALTYLICADLTSTSGKAKKARQLGVTMITEDDFEKMATS
jgi:DNA ligase (NAD+)